MTKDKPIYLCEHHEMAFYYWCKAKKEMKIDDPFFLVTIDAHTDLQSWGLRLDFRKEINELDLNDLERIEELVARPRGSRKNIVAYMQSRVAMETGLVGDVLIVSPEIPNEEIYEDLSKRAHRIFHCLHPNRLKDLLVKNEVLRKSIGYDKNVNSNLILDIDLDFFTYLDQQKVAHVLKEREFREIFSSDSPLWWIHENAKLITISEEPYWCGGKDNSEHIFKSLETYFLEKQKTGT
jgi:hypothetical protein